MIQHIQPLTGHKIWHQLRDMAAPGKTTDLGPEATLHIAVLSPPGPSLHHDEKTGPHAVTPAEDSHSVRSEVTRPGSRKMGKIPGPTS